MNDDFVAKISLPGYDVNTSNTLELALDSSRELLQAEEKNCGIFNYTMGSVTSSPTTVLTVPHGYSYTPTHLVYVEDLTSTNYASTPYTLDAFTSPFRGFYSYCNATNLVVMLTSIQTGEPGKTFRIKYYIFTEDGL